VINEEVEDTNSKIDDCTEEEDRDNNEEHCGRVFEIIFDWFHGEGSFAIAIETCSLRSLGTIAILKESVAA
jgi:hypothetical protein